MTEHEYTDTYYYKKEEKERQSLQDRVGFGCGDRKYLLFAGSALVFIFKYYRYDSVGVQGDFLLYPDSAKYSFKKGSFQQEDSVNMRGDKS